MNLHRFQTHLSALGLLLICASQANAAPTTAAPVPPIAPKNDDVLKFLALSKAEQALKLPLDLTVENASLTEVVARVRNVLSARKGPRLPHVEIRGVQPIKLSFAIKNSTVGGVLSAAATLSGGKLWVLGDYAVIAPKMALTTGEVAAQKEGLLSGWTARGLDSDLKNNIAKQKAFASLIVSEIDQSTTLSAMGSAFGGLNPPSVKTLTLGDLSPDARLLLSDLVGSASAGLMGHGHLTNGALFTLSPQDTIQFNPDQQGRLILNFTSSGQQSPTILWHTDGQGATIAIPDGSESSGSPAQKPSAPLPIPSAGGS